MCFYFEFYSFSQSFPPYCTVFVSRWSSLMEMDHLSSSYDFIAMTTEQSPSTDEDHVIQFKLRKKATKWILSLD